MATLGGAPAAKQRRIDFVASSPMCWNAAVAACLLSSGVHDHAPAMVVVGVRPRKCRGKSREVQTCRASGVSWGVEERARVSAQDLAEVFEP